MRNGNWKWQETVDSATKVCPWCEKATEDPAHYCQEKKQYLERVALEQERLFLAQREQQRRQEEAWNRPDSGCQLWDRPQGGILAHGKQHTLSLCRLESQAMAANKAIGVVSVLMCGECAQKFTAAVQDLIRKATK